MQVAEVMTREVVTVAPGDTLRRAAQLMTEHQVSGLPVVDDGRLVGMLTESDFIKHSSGPGRRRWIDTLFGRSEPSGAAKVEDLMTKRPVTIAPDRPLRDAGRLMIDADVKRLPVVDGAGGVLGILSRADVMKSYSRSDTEIADEIRDVLHEYIVHGVRLEVSDGLVTLEGTVPQRTESRLAEELVRRVDGVMAVTNHLAWDSDDYLTLGK